MRQLGVASAGALLAPIVLRGQSGDLTIAGQPVEIAIASVNPETVRLTARLVGGGSDAILADGALAKPDVGNPLARLRTRQSVRAGDQTVTVSVLNPSDPASPIRIGVAKTAGSPIQLEIDRATGAVRFPIQGAPVFGLGEGGPQFDRRGSVFPNRSGQGGYQLQTHGGRVPIQWLIHAGGFGLYVHQPLGSFDLTGSDGRFDPPAAGPLPLDLFVVASTDPVAILRAYADITGYPEMPPRWSLGYMQSHRTLAGPDEVLGVARTLRDKHLPCDALIYLGTDFTPSGWNTHNGEFTWNPANFPDPKAMIDELHAAHFKVVLHIVLEGRRLTGRVTDPCTAEPLPAGRTIDGQWPTDRQVSCYWPAHKPLFDLGIDGWWPDQGDGLDAPSRLARNVMYWEGSLQYRPNDRPFALHRNGYVGMARRAAFLWSGDVYSRWETLKTHVPNAINTSLSGIPYWGTDIGGFVPTAELTGELYVRWFQFGAFCPLFRSHGRTWHLRLPWGWNTGELGPSEVQGYGGGAANPPASELHNAAVEPICKQYLELRYRLLPYLYSAVRECHDTGLPIMRALWLHYPDDPQAIARGDEYLWGRDMLVAPVVEQGATSRRVYLPPGGWYDFWTEERVMGGREIDRPVDLGTMPLYVRAGAIIPMSPVRQYADEAIAGPLELVAYPGADGRSSLYEDDGRSFAYRAKDWMWIETTWHDAARRVSLRLAPGSAMRPPSTRPFSIRLAGSRSTKVVTFDGRPIDVTQ
jgi:alpha-glucosidase (family GH31 glycosyl hydrolase)